jgi:nucleoside-diphosphate-sugar epimerase
VAFDAADARQLAASNTASVTLWSSRLRAFIAMRSTARLTRPPQTGFPQLPDPIPETQPTVDPGPSTYSTRKIALERHLLDESTTSVTILRSGAIYGVDSRSPREWWFAKRMLDRRPAIPLAYLGRSQFHTTAATNISALIRVAAEKPSKRVLNIADPIASSVADIAACITQHLG